MKCSNCGATGPKVDAGQHRSQDCVAHLLERKEKDEARIDELESQLADSQARVAKLDGLRDDLVQGCAKAVAEAVRVRFALGLYTEQQWSEAEVLAKIATLTSPSTTSKNAEPKWSCPYCVIRADATAPMGRVVAACHRCIPLHQRTPKTHPNPLEREPDTLVGSLAEDYRISRRRASARDDEPLAEAVRRLVEQSTNKPGEASR